MYNFESKLLRVHISNMHDHDIYVHAYLENFPREHLRRMLANQPDMKFETY